MKGTVGIKAKRSKISEKITPGEQTVGVISAMPGGIAEKILREIARPTAHNPGNKRVFGDWEDGRCAGYIEIEATGEKRELVLILGAKEGLFLSDEDPYSRFSLRHACDGDACTIHVANSTKRRCSRKRNVGKDTAISTVANNIVGTWVVHGRNWTDRYGDTHYWPYGVDLNRKPSYDFEVVDGKGALFADVAEKGAMRSVHPGTWKQNVTIVPAASGLPILLHEFEERAGGKNDVTSFGEVQISKDEHLWGPYARWSLDNSNGHFGNFRRLAEVSSSPFAFHVAATRSVFPNSELASAFILRNVGEEKMLQVLNKIAQSDPERAYRLIDEEGLTWRMTGIQDRYLVFALNGKQRLFAIEDVPVNVLETFREMALIQGNPSHIISRKERVVLDSHFYVVLIALLTHKDGEAYHLGGTDMHRYLTEGRDAEMHRTRNERLFELLRPFFGGVKKMRFYIYPSVGLGLPGINQYNFDPAKWKPEFWEGKRLG